MLWEEVDRSLSPGDQTNPQGTYQMYGSSFASMSKNIFLKVVHLFRIPNTGEIDGDEIRGCRLLT